MSLCSSLRTAILVVNLGTPETPTTKSVKLFLKQFLTDKRVVDMHPFLWYPILYGVILPKRSKKVAELYKQIWFPEGSPLFCITKAITDNLQLTFFDEKNVTVMLAMTYGEPSIAACLNELQARCIERVIVLPLYPQYSYTTTAAIEDQVLAYFRHHQWQFKETFLVADYAEHPLYIEAISQSIEKFYLHNDYPDMILLSYHGIPKRYAQNGDHYANRCEATTKQLQQHFADAPFSIMMSYQSRFGREEWLQPYTSEFLTSLPRKGVFSVDVICPGFAADCLETLEEIAEQNREKFLASGGKQYRYIPALNNSPEHIRLLKTLINTGYNFKKITVAD